MKRVVDSVFRNAGLVNTYLIEVPGTLVLIDTGFPGSERGILAAMKQLGYAPNQLGHIVLTHAHPDHIGSLAALVRATGAQTWMHEIDAPLTERAEMRPVHPAPTWRAKLLFSLMQILPRKIAPAQIDHRVKDGDILPFGLQVIHVPGHCAGQIALLWPEKSVMFVADSCMNLRGLRPPLVNEDAALGLTSLRRLSTFDFDTACFGHGGPILEGAAAALRKALANIP